MTTISLPTYDGAQRVTHLRVVRSEWTKLRSLPSTIWALLTALAMIVGFGVLYSMVRVTRPPDNPADFDAVGVSLTGVQLAQLAVGVLGVLLITGEYATGSIRVSLAAVPSRLQLLWGKVVAFALTMLVLAVPAVVLGFFASQSILSAENLDASLRDPGALRAVLGGALFLTVVGLLGLGLGALLRSTAGGVASLLGLLLAPQILVGFLPDSLAVNMYKYVPSQAGQAILFVKPDPKWMAEPWTGFGVFCLYTAIVLGLATWRMRKRDI
jgi:ABC-2 type transport system permease protein